MEITVDSYGKMLRATCAMLTTIFFLCVVVVVVGRVLPLVVDSGHRQTTQFQFTHTKNAKTTSDHILSRNRSLKIIKRNRYSAVVGRAQLFFWVARYGKKALIAIGMNIFEYYFIDFDVISSFFNLSIEVAKPRPLHGQIPAIFEHEKWILN